MRYYSDDVSGAVALDARQERQGSFDRATTISSRPLPMIVTAIGFFMVILDTTIVNVALPTRQGDLGGGISGLQWIAGGYAIVFASLLLTGGALSDRFGARNAFLSGLAIFTISSGLCGSARTLFEPNIARLLQGVGAALMVPAMLALLAEAYRPPCRGARCRHLGG